MSPRSVRVELPQHFGLPPGTSMIQSFGSTQRRDALGRHGDPDVRGLLGSAPREVSKPTSVAGQFPRAMRFARHEEDAHPGPGAYSPPNIHSNSGSHFPPRSFQRPPTRTGHPPGFNSSAPRELQLGAGREQTPGLIYSPVDAFVSTVHATPSERALASARAGARARWADTAPSAVFATRAPRVGASSIGAESDAPGPAHYNLPAKWPPGPPLVDPARRVTAFSAAEPRFRPTSQGGARVLTGVQGDRRSWPSPSRTYRAASYTGVERPTSSILASSASFAGPPRWRAQRPVAGALGSEQHARAVVKAIAEAPVPAGSQAARWPKGNQYMARFEARWRAVALSE
ncbi:hypothetical protein KFE25_007396 [Diacronema lutheri]|uniref:Uncharacterized protein n=1 Tax=Diacronema lutheri TaxID=2081491 RepID=A0A8J6CIJ1_DIALT|nr:hypothetical protein KFE25_007396 [Diacronema lutheri]